MKCPTCGTENKPEAQFCGSCGTDLSETDTNVVVQQPRVGFRDAVLYGFKGILTFKGRATRAEFWWWRLFIELFIPLSLAFIYFAKVLIDKLLPDGGLLIILSIMVNLLYFAVLLIYLVGGIAITTRRLHDNNKSGWWQLSVFLIIPIVILLIWLIKQGNKGPNKYGPDPRTRPS